MVEERSKQARSLVCFPVGPSINVVGNWEGEGSKIGQNCQRIVVNNCRYGEGGDKNSEKLTTSFIDGPRACLSNVL